jgi:predicted deacetylase
VSLHDVTPVHRDRLSRAEELFTRLGVPHVTYLYGPCFHGAPDASLDADFVRWCRGPRPYHVQWFLHGLRHVDDSTRAANGWRSRMARRTMTAGEGEFLALDDDDARARLREGRASFERTFGAPPDGFVAPAWLTSPTLRAVLAELGFRYSEDHWRVYDVADGQAIDAPAITWATRSWWRRIGSRFVCPLLARRWSNHDVIRLAVHPHDFDHPTTVGSIEVVLTGLMQRREVVPLDARCFD